VRDDAHEALFSLALALALLLLLSFLLGFPGVRKVVLSPVGAPSSGSRAGEQRGRRAAAHQVCSPSDAHSQTVNRV
jgi:hypothetical protein